MVEFDKENQKTAKILIRKARALEHRSSREISLNAAQLGVFGWQLSIPVLAGVFIGRFADTHFPSSFFSWTLNLIFIGFVIGIINAFYWLHKEGIVRNADHNSTKQRKKRKK